jgi:hypothetical protein
MEPALQAENNRGIAKRDMREKPLRITTMSLCPLSLLKALQNI